MASVGSGGDTSARLQRVLSRLQNLPAIALPTDYPRPSGPGKVVEAVEAVNLSEQASLSLLKLTLYNENEEELEESEQDAQDRPSAFQLLLAAFVVLLHRYTGDTDLVIASSSASKSDPLLLRLSVDPSDPFWAVVRRVQQVEKQAEEDAVPFEAVAAALEANADAEIASRPIFRVRFFDETDAPHATFVNATGPTSDLTITVGLARGAPGTSTPASSRASLTPRIALRITYNALLFAPARISFITEQLSVLLRRVGASPVATIGAVPLLTPAQRAHLPDPAADLHWCDYKGAITDIFSQNARIYPDRPCVVQYTPERARIVHTYSTIRRASNILAHHLLQNGVQREEVVTVYAHRSVDLVIAVMAVLKAGATFSVIGEIGLAITLPESNYNARSRLPTCASDHLSPSC